MAGLSFSLPFAGGGGIGMGMGLPPLSLSSAAHSGQDNSGAAWSASGYGDWSVNLGGSGMAMQSASGGVNWLLIAAAVGAVWLLNQR